LHRQTHTMYSSWRFKEFPIKKIGVIAPVGSQFA
jgi:hypothetical protein